MNKLLVSLLLFFPLFAFSQTSTDKIARAFPITDYVVELNDSVKLVQVYVAQAGVISDKQFGLLKSAYANGADRPDEIGVGRCQLIKGEYYYFAINIKESQKSPIQGDLLYISVPKPSVFIGRVVNVALYSILLTDVKENPFYDLSTIFTSWTDDRERAALDSMIKDVRYTADYFLENNPSMNVQVKAGVNKGKLIFSVMKASTVKELQVFLDYVRNHLRMYAGREWKISEIFATWLAEGSPQP